MTKSILFLLFTSLIFLGCKKNETNNTEDEVLEIKGVIKLPSGMNQNVSGFSLNSYRTEQLLSNNEYAVEVTKNDYNLQFLSDQTEKDIMIGFSFPNQTDFTIDANSTLLGLVMKLPSVNSLSSQGKLNFISKVKTSSKYSDALIAVENHIKAGKDIFDTTDVIMRDKISQLFDQAALRRSGFGYNGQAYITKVDKTITIGNPGVSFAQVAGIYNNNQRIAKLDIDRYKFYVSSITEIPTTLSSPPSPIEKSFTFTQDGVYQIKLRNGGFNPVTNDIESEEAIILNGINLVLDNIKVFLPIDVSAKCPSAIYNAVKAKVDASKNAMKVTSDKTQFIALVYNITKATLNELKIGTSCASFTIKGNKYIDKIFKYLKWLDLVGKVGTNLNNTIFALEYFTSNSNDPRSALDTTIIIGNPPVSPGQWYVGKYTLGHFGTSPQSPYYNCGTQYGQQGDVYFYININIRKVSTYVKSITEISNFICYSNLDSVYGGGSFQYSFGAGFTENYNQIYNRVFSTNTLILNPSVEIKSNFTIGNGYNYKTVPIGSPLNCWQGNEYVYSIKSNANFIGTTPVGLTQNLIDSMINQ